MVKLIYLLGGGGHGRVVLDALLSSAVDVAGILDPELKIADQVFGVPVMGDDKFLNRFSASDVLLVNGVGANPCVGNRKRLFKEMQARGFSFFDAVRHPSAVIGMECSLDGTSQIMAGVVLQNHVRVGANAVINTHATVDHDCVIGAHAFISPGAVLSGNALVGESAFIGAGAVVLPGVEIGSNAVVGAGAIVVKSVPAKWIVAGNPAVKIGVSE